MSCCFESRDRGPGSRDPHKAMFFRLRIGKPCVSCVEDEFLIPSYEFLLVASSGSRVPRSGSRCICEAVA